MKWNQWKTSTSDWVELCKVGICTMALCMAAAAYSLDSPGPIAWSPFGVALLGIALLGAGSAIANHVMEWRWDALMNRTRHRPIPCGRVSRKQATLVSAACIAVGLALLWKTNPVTFGLGVATALSYLAIYTPLKRVSTLAPLAGAVPGALPAALGSAAATGHVGWHGFMLFWIVFLWQIPHFLSLASMYADDYTKAGFPILPALYGWAATGLQIFSYALALVLVSMLPSVIGLTGNTYFIGTLVLGLVFVAMCWQFLRDGTLARARRVFFGSLFYLPLVALLMLWDHIDHV